MDHHKSSLKYLSENALLKIERKRWIFYFENLRNKIPEFIWKNQYYGFKFLPLDVLPFSIYLPRRLQEQN